ncbi:MAG: putative Ig domain-containing protein [Actinobacteria bacterium]|nr:putative Ig domain-containing protein [Actinomycetota bacterium]
MRLLKGFVLVALLAGAYAPLASAGGYTDASYNTPTGKVGTPYSHTVAWKPGTGCPPYGYSVVGGAFPPGLSLSSSSGNISGTPTQAGTYTFYIRQTDNCGIEGEGNAPFVITILGGAPPLVVTSSTLGTGEADLSYSVMLTASGGATTSRNWSVTAGALPAGLTLGSDGHLSGTPTAVGSFSFTATVSDGTTSSSKSLTVTIIPGITVNASPIVPLAEVRTDYSASAPTMLGVTGGVPPYRYAPVSGFPFGIGFDSATGRIFGSPREPGVINLTIAITDANGATKQATLTVTVLAKLHIVSPRLARGTVGKSYHANVSVAGGHDPVWARPSGKLPAGLKLNSATGAITGLPKRAGTFHFTVSVKDALGAAVSIRYVLVIRR